jgi:YD repeat-containing protein
MREDKTGKNRIWYFYEDIYSNGEDYLRLVVDSIGREIEFNYDDYGNLVSIKWTVKVVKKDGNTRSFVNEEREVKYSYVNAMEINDPEPLIDEELFNKVINKRTPYLLKTFTDVMDYNTEYDYQSGYITFTFNEEESHNQNVYLMLNGISAFYDNGSFLNKRIFEYDPHDGANYKKDFIDGYMEYYKITHQYFINYYGTEMSDTSYIYHEKGEGGNSPSQESAVIEIGNVKWSPVKYKYPRWAGLYKENNQFLYVNRGFGYIGFPGRVGMPPEITVLELHKA